MAGIGHTCRRAAAGRNVGGRCAARERLLGILVGIIVVRHRARDGLIVGVVMVIDIVHRVAVVVMLHVGGHIRLVVS